MRQVPAPLRVLAFSSVPGLCGCAQTAVLVHPGLLWSGWVGVVSEVVDRCVADRADVLLVDARDDADWKLCLFVTRMFPELTVVALLDEPRRDPVAASWALLHGVHGIVPTDATPDRLGLAMIRAAEGGHYVDPWLRISTGRPPHADPTQPDTLARLRLVTRPGGLFDARPGQGAMR